MGIKGLEIKRKKENSGFEKNEMSYHTKMMA
jgi:hypothetical protein